MPEPRISIIIPVYNGEKWINSCMESILVQDFKDFEVILINDGSTDGTEKIAMQWCNKDERLFVYTTNNNGAAEARNYGLNKAKGKYIYFCDIDDLIEKNTLSCACRAIEENDADLSIFGYYMELVDKNDRVKISQKYTLGRSETFRYNPEQKDIILELWNKSLMYNLVNRLFKKSIIEDNNIQFNNIILGEDMEFCNKYISFCNKISVIPNCLYHYVRERNDSVTSSYRDDLFEVRLREHINLTNFFKKQNLFDENFEEFLNRRFLERVLGCIQMTMGKGNKEKLQQKANHINEIINNEYVRYSFKNVSFTSIKTKVLMKILKSKLIVLNCFMGWGISLIKDKYSELFFKLKTSR